MLPLMVLLKHSIKLYATCSRELSPNPNGIGMKKWKKLCVHIGTTYRTPTQATPYSLAFGVEAVLPLEHQIPSLRLVIQEGFTEEENARLRLAELEALDEKRLQAQQNLECYQARLSRAFNKKVHLRCFKVGDQVLAVRRPIITSHKSGGKFTSK